MIVHRPSIYIYVNRPDEKLLREIYSGIEEEGVFYEISERNESELNQLAYDAANESMLGSGIGVLGNSVAFQIRGVKYGKNVEEYENPTNTQARKIGANSARAIKKQSFK